MQIKRLNAKSAAKTIQKEHKSVMSKSETMMMFFHLPNNDYF